MGAGVVGPMPAHLSRQSGTADVGVALGIPKPTSVDVRPGLHKSRPAYTSQYAAIIMYGRTGADTG